MSCIQIVLSDDATPFTQLSTQLLRTALTSGMKSCHKQLLHILVAPLVLTITMLCTHTYTRFLTHALTLMLNKPQHAAAGTACTALAGVYGGLAVQHKPPSAITGMKFVVCGAGSAGLGVVSWLAKAMIKHGLTPEEAYGMHNYSIHSIIHSIHSIYDINAWYTYNATLCVHFSNATTRTERCTC
jgi:Malic enzyme, NAD binding domain